LTITLVAGWHFDALLACQRPTAYSKAVPVGTATYALVHVLLTSPLGDQIYQLLSSETIVVLSAHWCFCCWTAVFTATKVPPSEL
jgi:aromatic ring-opening dioxygenase catalytic subunit (LigB family)